MQDNYRFQEVHNQLRLVDETKGYSLVFPSQGSFRATGIVFNVSRPGVNGGFPMLVTARDLDEYHPDIRNTIINPNFQYVEIGGGLGGFMTHVTRSLTRE